MNTLLKRYIALLLALVMTLSMGVSSAFAAGTEAPPETESSVVSREPAPDTSGEPAPEVTEETVSEETEATSL